MHRFLFILLLAATSLHAEELVFSTVGCGPYTPQDEKALVAFIRAENEAKAADFIIHLGDIFSGKLARETVVDEKAYAKVRGYLTNGNTIPTYIIPGDNEWNDMPDPDTAWKWWASQFLRLEEDFKPAWATAYQDVRPENFAFVRKGVLLVGINLVGGLVHDPAEWQRRFAENNLWIEAQLSQHKAEVRAAVVFAQANPVGFGEKGAAVNKTFGPFVREFVGHATAFGKPVLFLHSDGHKWIENQPWKKEANNVTRVQIDLIAPQFPPLRVTVRDRTTGVFSFDRQLPASAPKEKKK